MFTPGSASPVVKSFTCPCTVNCKFPLGSLYTNGLVSNTLILIIDSSSELANRSFSGMPIDSNNRMGSTLSKRYFISRVKCVLVMTFADPHLVTIQCQATQDHRSEERRVGKECRSRRAQ